MKAKELKEQVLKEIDKQINHLSRLYNCNDTEDENNWYKHFASVIHENIIINVNNFSCRISPDQLLHMKNRINKRFPNKDKAPTENKTIAKKLKPIFNTQLLIDQINEKTSYLSIKEQKKELIKSIKSMYNDKVYGCYEIDNLQRLYIINNYSQYLN